MMSALLSAAAALCIATKPALPQPVDSGALHMSMTELLLAAPGGNPDAQYRLGIHYQTGLGLEKDDFEAAHWYEKAALQGHLEAVNALGMLLYAHDDYTNAAIWFERGAEAGDAKSQCNLAALYRKGVGVSRNDELAFHWFQKSALQNSALAQAELGRMYKSGLGTQQDYVAAYQWLKLAQLQEVQGADSELKACAALMTPEQIAAAEQQVEKFRAGAKEIP
jgi:hypothetical protein